MTDGFCPQLTHPRGLSLRSPIHRRSNAFRPLSDGVLPDSLRPSIRVGNLADVTQPTGSNSDTAECRTIEIDDATRRALSVASVVASSAAGWTGAFLVWNFIFGIGARVVDHQIYARLQGRVTLWGFAAGVLTGLATVLLLRRPALGVLVAGHAVATLAGCSVGGSVGWQEGLWAYFGALASFVMVVGYRALFRLLFLK